jgi:hypothetical protein
VPAGRRCPRDAVTSLPFSASRAFRGGSGPRGVEIEGEAVAVAPVPRTGEEPQPPELADPERRMAAKYFDPASLAASGGGPEMTHDGRHAWLRITPLKLVSWDFRKLADLP